jgi:hypothetical protein
MVSTLLAQARDLARKISPRELEVKIEDMFVLCLYWRSIRLFDGIIALLEKDLPEEALILGRSLFVEALRLAEIEAAGVQRVALVLGWENTSIEEKKGLFKEASKLGLEFDPTPILRQLDEEQRKLHAYRKDHGIGKLRRFLSEREAAIKYGRAHDYWTYALSHEIVHGSDASFIFNRDKVTTGKVSIRDRTPDPNLQLGITCFVVKSVLQAAKATASVFGWQGTDQLDRLYEEVTDLEERLTDGG